MQLFLGDVYAVQGKFTDAARIYKKIGQPSRAMTMYTDLRMFDLAKVTLPVLVIAIQAKCPDLFSNIHGEPQKNVTFYF